MEGRKRGYQSPEVKDIQWINIINPKITPYQWLGLDLGLGEIFSMALTLEYAQAVLLIDDELARRVAQHAGITVWGTLKVLLESKKQNYVKGGSEI